MKKYLCKSKRDKEQFRESEKEHEREESKNRRQREESNISSLELKQIC